MKRATGHVADHSEVARLRRGVHLHPNAAEFSTAAAALPMATANRTWWSPSVGGPGIQNQGQLGACEGFAHAAGGTLVLALRGQSPGLISGVALYLGALLVDRQTLLSGKLTVVTDTGTTPASINAAWDVFGAMLAKDDPQFPANRATLYVNPNDDNSPLFLPAPETLYQDGSYRFGGAYYIADASPASRLLRALSVLAAKLPITDAIPASGDFFQSYRGGIVGRLDGPTDHANLIVDYEWTGTPEDWATFQSALRNGDTTTITSLRPGLVLHCANSWGETGWGEADSLASSSGGWYRANTDYFDQTEDLSVLDIEPA